MYVGLRDYMLCVFVYTCACVYAFARAVVYMRVCVCCMHGSYIYRFLFRVDVGCVYMMACL